MELKQVLSNQFICNMKFTLSLVLCMAALLSQAQMTEKKLVNGKLVSIKNFDSKFVLSRNVDIWLPEQYNQDSSTRYAVIYMQDGQNLFDSSTAYGGVEWKIDETLSRLMDVDSIKKVIVVGIWNSPKRFLEYDPAKAFQKLPEKTQTQLEKEFDGRPLSDQYLQFIVKELKPFIDDHFRTQKDRNNTMVAGSSMGGLISMYALFEYPDIFSSAACISTHWPVSIKSNGPEAPKALLRYMENNFPKQPCKIYFDHGTATLDSRYAPYQSIIDIGFKQHAPKNLQWLSKIYVGAAHNEASWRERFGAIAVWMLGK